MLIICISWKNWILSIKGEKPEGDSVYTLSEKELNILLIFHFLSSTPIYNVLAGLKYIVTC